MVPEVEENGIMLNEKLPKPEILCEKNKKCPVLLSFKYYYIIIFIVLFLILICSTIGVYYIWFTNIFEMAILTNFKLINNSDSFIMWKDPPMKPLYKVHIFNYTNVERYTKQLDKKLIVKDIGPYVYEESIHRVNYIFNDNNSITYQENRTYEFKPELSGMFNKTDTVIVPNIPTISTVSLIRDSMYLTRWSLSKLLNTLDSKPFINQSVDNVLWGYDDTLFSLGKTIAGAFGYNVPKDKFGLLVQRNGVSDHKITINTGENDINKIGQIELLDGRNVSGIWTGECDRVSGTDGTVFPVNVTEKGQTIHVYNYDLCRPLPFEFNKYIQFNLGKNGDAKIEARRYKLPKNVFSRPELVPENKCFCHIATNVCPPEGLFNATPCAMGAPILGSLPHFLLGDKNIQNSIEGLKPDPAIHEAYVDVLPELGLSLSAMSRLQVNVQIRKADGITNLDPLPDGMILPIMWIDMGLESLPDNMVNLIYKATITATRIKTALKTFSLLCLVSSLLAIICLICYIIAKFQRNKKSNNQQHTVLPCQIKLLK